MPINQEWFSFDKHVSLAPEKQGAYELGDAKHVVVYIGKSNHSVKKRLLLHRKMKRFMKVKYFRFRLTDHPSRLERELIKEFKKNNNGKLPRLQRREPPKRTPSLFDF
jgi:excinuclease UvrABC nuclease subunit